MEISLTQSKQLSDVFQFFDADGTGSISADQFRQAMNQVGRFDAAALEPYCAGGSVRYEEFLATVDIQGESGGSYATTSHSDALLPSTAISEEQVKHLLSVIKNKISEHGENAHELFLRFDEDRNGSISPQEFSNVMNNHLGVPVTGAEVELLLAPFDVDHNGLIDYQEFIRWMHLWEPQATGLNWSRDSVQHHESAAEHHLHENQRIVAAQYEEAHRQSLEQLTPQSSEHQVINKIAHSLAEKELNLRKAFNKWDKDGSGALEMSEFIKALEELGFTCDEELARHIFDAFDVKHDHKIKYHEFVRTLGTADAEEDMSRPRPVSASRRPIHSAVNLSEHLNDEELLYANLSQVGDDEDLSAVVAKVRAGVDASPQTLSQLFAGWDARGRGSLDPIGVKKALMSLGLNVSRAKAEQLVGAFDSNRDGRLSLFEWENMLRPPPAADAPAAAPSPALGDMSDDEFLAYAANKIQEQGIPAHKVFQMMSPDGSASGTMSQDDLKNALEAITGHAIDDAMASRLMQRIDADHDGQVSAWEFCRGLADAGAPAPAPAAAAPVAAPAPAPVAAAAPAPVAAAPAPAPVAAAPAPALEQTLIDCGPSELLDKLALAAHRAHLPMRQLTHMLDETGTGKTDARSIANLGADIDAPFTEAACLRMMDEYNPDGRGTMPCWMLMQLLTQHEAAIVEAERAESHAEHERMLAVEREARRKQLELAQAALTPEQRRAQALRDNGLVARLREDLFDRHREMHTMFQRLDRDGSQAISAEEMQLGLERAGVAASLEDAERLLNYFDRDHDGQLSYEELVRLLQDARDIAVHDTGVRDMAHLGGERLYDGYRESVAVGEGAEGPISPVVASGNA